MFDIHCHMLPAVDDGADSTETACAMARAAAAVGIDVLFTEVHPRPDEAWSDGPNSLDFRQIREILTKVKAIHDLVGNI